LFKDTLIGHSIGAKSNNGLPGATASSRFFATIKQKAGDIAPALF
jgi:hypothetical protein